MAPATRSATSTSRPNACGAGGAASGGAASGGVVARSIRDATSSSSMLTDCRCSHSCSSRLAAVCPRLGRASIARSISSRSATSWRNRSRELRGRPHPAPNGCARQLVDASELQMAPDLGLSLEQPLGIGERIRRAGEDQVHVRLVRAERADHHAVERVERHAPFDRGRCLGNGPLHDRTQLLQDCAERRRLFGEETVDGRAVVRAPRHRLLRGLLRRGFLRARHGSTGCHRSAILWVLLACVTTRKPSSRT